MTEEKQECKHKKQCPKAMAGECIDENCLYYKPVEQEEQWANEICFDVQIQSPSSQLNKSEIGSTPQPFCSTCRYFDGDYFEEGFDGLCRRNPPSIGDDDGDGGKWPEWPEVSGKLDWCGEYSACSHKKEQT